MKPSFASSSSLCAYLLLFRVIPNEVKDELPNLASAYTMIFVFQRFQIIEPTRKTSLFTIDKVSAKEIASFFNFFGIRTEFVDSFWMSVFISPKFYCVKYFFQYQKYNLIYK
jgi:hypothetical protein